MAERTFFVIVPVYKVEKYIHDCFDSILNQDNGSFKIFAVDDGSPDKSGEICDEYAKKDRRIRVIHKENGGQALARSVAIIEALKEARDDDFLIFVDSDDTISPHTLSVLNKSITENGCDLLFYSMSRVENECKSATTPISPPFVGTVDDKAELYRIVFTNPLYNSLCLKAASASLVRRSKMQEVRYRAIGEDLLQSIPLYQFCERAVFIPDTLYNYNYNPSSTTHSVSYKNYNINSSLRYTVLKFLREQNVWNDNDFEGYLAYCRRLLKEQILTVSCFSAPSEDKIKILEDIRRDEYFSYLISTAGKNDFELLAVRKQRYRTLLIKSRLHFFISKAYHKIFR